MKSTEAGIKEQSNVYFATPGSRAQNLFYCVFCAGHFYYDDTYSLARENYNSLLFMYILKGTAKISCYGKTFLVKKDDIVLLNCHDPHGYSSVKDLETLWFHFDAKNGKELHREIYEAQGCVMNVQDPYMVKKNMQRIYDMHAYGQRINEALQSAYIARIIAELFAFENVGRDSQKNEIEDCIQYINDKYYYSISVKELADKAALSEYYFSRCFKKETGFTPHEYLIKTRINQAKILLKSTNKSLLEIAELCGLTNEANLIKTFKKHTDVTPGVFRRMFL